MSSISINILVGPGLVCLVAFAASLLINKSCFCRIKIASRPDCEVCIIKSVIRSSALPAFVLWAQTPFVHIVRHNNAPPAVIGPITAVYAMVLLYANFIDSLLHSGLHVWTL